MMRLIFCLLSALFLSRRLCVCSAVSRRIIDRIPILTEAEISQAWTEVTSTAECETKCETAKARSYLLAPDAKNRTVCLCSHDNHPLGHGLVNFKGSVFQEKVEDNRGLDSFLYMEIRPVEHPLFSDLSDTVADITLGDCALVCLNLADAMNRFLPAAGKACKSFYYDPVRRNCQLHNESVIVDGGEVERHPPEENPQHSSMYFELLDESLRSFSREWGVKEAGISIQEFVNTDLKDCAMKCFIKYECKSFNYFPIHKFCQLFDLTRTSGQVIADRLAVYFEQSAEQACSSTPKPTLSTTGIVRSPGWPYSLTSQPCSWRYVTPWGKSLFVKLEESKLNLKSGSECAQSLQINDGPQFCQTEKMSVEASTTGVNDLKMLTETKAKASSDSGNFGFVASYKSVWACRPDRAVVLQGPGQIASPNFPSPFVNTYCNWEIKPNASTQVVITIDLLNFHSSIMMESAVLTMRDAASTVKTCNKDVDCSSKSLTMTSPVQVTFYSGNYFRTPTGFKLSYNFEYPYPKPDFSSNQTLTLSSPEAVKEVEVTELQKHQSVYMVYDVVNSLPGGRIRLQLGKVAVGEDDGFRKCFGGTLQVEDPIQTLNYDFCQIASNGTVIESQGNSLRIEVKIPRRTQPPDSLPEQSFNFKVSAAASRAVIIKSINSSQVFESPNYPNSYPVRWQQEWRISVPEDQVPLLSLLDVRLAEFRVLNRSFCDNDRLLVTNGDKMTSFCGRRDVASLPTRIVPRGLMSVTLVTDDRFQGPGFQARVEVFPRLACRPGVNVSLTEDVGVMTSSPGKGDCTWNLRRAYLVFFLDGCENATISSSSSAAVRPSCRTRFVLCEAGSVVTWRQSANGFAAIAKLLLETTTEEITTATTTLETTSILETTTVAETTQQPTTTEAEATNQPATTEAVATNQPATTEAVATNQPATTEAVATNQPATTEAEATEQPTTAEAETTETTFNITTSGNITTEATTAGVSEVNSVTNEPATGPHSSTYSHLNLTTTSFPEGENSSSSGNLTDHRHKAGAYVSAATVAAGVLGFIFLAALVVIVVFMIMRRAGYSKSLFYSPDPKTLENGGVAINRGFQYESFAIPSILEDTEGGGATLLTDDVEDFRPIDDDPRVVVNPGFELELIDSPYIENGLVPVAGLENVTLDEY